MEDHEERQLRHDIHQIKQYAGCLVTTSGLIWILLACIFALLAFGCDTAPMPTEAQSEIPKKAWVDTVQVAPLSCPADEAECPPGLNIYYVTLGGDFGGMRLTIEGAQSHPDTLHLPDDPVAASGEHISEPKVTYTFHHVHPLKNADPRLIQWNRPRTRGAKPQNAPGQPGKTDKAFELVGSAG